MITPRAIIAEKLNTRSSPPPPQNPSGCDRCVREFFDRPCEQLAKALLGCVLVRQCGDVQCRGVVMETEAYLGGDDKAAHSYNGRKTDRNAAMFMPPGTAYVYAIYGMHNCFNISSRGEGAAVLVRALEAVGGVEVMRERRKAAKKDRDLCSGPAKLCQAMGIDRTCDKLDLTLDGGLWVEHGTVREEDVVSSARIGVDYAGDEWATKPLRFYIRDNNCVSKK